MDKFELLRKYKELLDEGLIEQEDFQKKKKEILSMPDVDSDIDIETNDPLIQEYDETVVEENLIETEVATLNEAENESESEIEHEHVNKEEQSVLQKEESVPKNKKKSKLIKRIILTVVGVCVGIFVFLLALGAFLSSTLPDLSEEEQVKQALIHEMNYEIPESWKMIDEDSSEVLHRYIKEDDGETIAIAEVEYTGEYDLKDGEAAYLDEHYIPDDIEDLLPEAEGTYDEVKVDNSVFEVTLYVEEATVNGEEVFLNNLINSFDVDSYENPRKSLGIKAEYTGDTEEGVSINSECEDITVVETFDTGVGEGTKELEWSIDNPGKLEADKTSTFKITFEDGSCELKIKCSTVSESGFKKQCKEYSYDSLARTPGDYEGKYIKVSGYVVQVINDGSSYRVATSGKYDDVVYVDTYLLNSDITTNDANAITTATMWEIPEKERFLEDDYITIYGVCDGIKTYTTVLGAEKQIPQISARYIDR